VLLGTRARSLNALHAHITVPKLNGAIDQLRLAPVALSQMLCFQQQQVGRARRRLRLRPLVGTKARAVANWVASVICFSAAT